MSLSRHILLFFLLSHCLLHNGCLASVQEYPGTSQEAPTSPSVERESSRSATTSSGDSGSPLRIPPSVNPQYGPRCEVFRGVEPFWVPPSTGSHHYWQRAVLPVRTKPPLVDLRSYPTVGMYEATPQVPLFPQAAPGQDARGPAEQASTTLNKVKAPTLEPEPWKEIRPSTQFSDEIHSHAMVVRAMEAALLWVLEHLASSFDPSYAETPQFWLHRPSSLGDAIDLLEACRRVQSSILLVAQTGEGDLATSVSDLLGIISKVFKEEMVQRVRYWILAANRPSASGSDGKAGGGFYLRAQERISWLLSNKILRKTNVIEADVIDPELVDCEHMQYTSASRSSLQVLFKDNDKSYKDHFCSYSVTAWIAYAIYRIHLSADSEGEARKAELRQMAADLQTHPHFSSLPSKITDLVAFGSES